jgi:hypothetical protein
MTDLSVPKAEAIRQEESTEVSEVPGTSLVNDQLPVRGDVIEPVNVSDGEERPQESAVDPSDIAERDIRPDSPKTATAIIQDVMMETIVGNAADPPPSEESGPIPSESVPPPGESAPDSTPQSESENAERLLQFDSEHREPIPDVLRSEIILNPSESNKMADVATQSEPVNQDIQEIVAVAPKSRQNPDDNPATVSDTPETDNTAPLPDDIQATIADTPLESESVVAQENATIIDDGTATPTNSSESPIFKKTQIGELGPDISHSRAAGTAVPVSSSEEYLDAILTKMVKRHILPDFEVRPEVINFARKKSSKLMLAEEYDEAAEIDVAIDVMFVSIEQDRNERNSDSQTQVLRDRMAQCKEGEQEVANFWDGAMEDFRQRTLRKLEALRQRHLEEYSELEAEWSAPEAKIPYSKPSPDLLQIRKKQKSYALLHDFANAKAMKLMGDSRETIEAAEGQRRFENAFRIAHNQLIDRQQREIDCLVASAQGVTDLYQIDKEKSLASLAFTEKSLQLRISTAKPMKRPSVKVPVLNSRPVRASPGDAPHVPTTGMITHRTRSQLAAFRKAPDMGRLDLWASPGRMVVRPGPMKAPSYPALGSFEK